ncbi:MAG: type II toxin-antitoxin system RelE/ParE family toxin [Deltaproteobacteria bacterium]|nr:type II toxin-antitoxin system RelE/ParE family toxin [Deltaproteobacteria bacterium]
MKAAHEWWVQNRDEAPDLLRNEIARVAAALTEAPSIGRPVVEARQSGVRCFPMRRVRYELYYRVSDDGTAIQVLHLRHFRRGTKPQV